MKPDSGAEQQGGVSGTEPADEPSGDSTGAPNTVVETTLVEGISIDGMCGVY